MKKNRDLVLGISTTILFLIWGLSWKIFGGEGLQFDLDKELLPPFTVENFLGTDIYGRSLFALISEGLIYSVTFSLSVTLSCLIMGGLIGFLMASSKSWIAKCLEIITNLIFILPAFLIAILIVSFSNEGIQGLYFALVITGWPAFAKVTKTESERILSLPFVEAQLAYGAGKRQIFFKSILRNIWAPLLIQSVLGIGSVIILESSLSFLGLGGSPFSWGAMLSMSKNVLLEAPYMTITLSLVLSSLIIGFNLLGDGLRDHLDPKNR